MVPMVHKVKLEEQDQLVEQVQQGQQDQQDQLVLKV